MEPPPAPTVRTSTEGARTATSPTRVSRRMRAWLSSISATSVEVPPTSKVSTLLKPPREQNQIAPATPPAGPDSSRLTGVLAADWLVARPPSERRMDSFTSGLRRRDSSPCRCSR